MIGREVAPELYLLPGPAGAVVTPRIAALVLSRSDVLTVWSRHRGQDPEFDASLAALQRCARTWRASVDGTLSRKPTEVATGLSVMTTNDVAEQLMVSPSRVRQECRDGRLRAVNAGRPRGWLIRREDFEQYKAARAAREE